MSTLSVVSQYGGAGTYVPASNSADDPTPPVVTMASLSKTSKKRRTSSISIGDDLPHMPEERRSSRSSVVRSPQSPPYQYQPWAAGTTVRTPSNWTPPKYAPPASMSSAKQWERSGRRLSIDTETTQRDDKDRFGGMSPALPAASRLSYSAQPATHSALVDRERDRLQGQCIKDVQMRWRIITGVAMLFVLGVSTYVLARYILAWLSLSPSNFVLSDTTKGTQISPDPLLRNVALAGIVLCSISVLGILSSGFYLRKSRRRSCGTCTIWLFAIVSTTLQLALSVANLALIALWHRQYTGKAADASSPYALTRDVAQRCSGVWDMDLLWSAASASNVAKPSDDNNNGQPCAHDAKKMLMMYFVAGGVRLAVLAVLCTIWMACLAKYNRTLALSTSEIALVAQSTEMRQLLEDEEKERLDALSGAWDAKPKTMASQFAYDEQTLTVPPEGGEWGFVEEEGQPVVLDTDVEDEPRKGTVPAPVPRLQRFAWQRNEPSMYEAEPEPNGGARTKRAGSTDATPGGAAGVWEFGNIGRAQRASRSRRQSSVQASQDEGAEARPGHAERDVSAGGWFERVMGAVFSTASSAVSAPPAAPSQAWRDASHRAEQGESLLAMPEAQEVSCAEMNATKPAQWREQRRNSDAEGVEAHTRGRSRLGVSGWFGRDTSSCSLDEREASVDRKYPDVSVSTNTTREDRATAATAPVSPLSRAEARGPPSPASAGGHQRTASQERRATAARHAASRTSPRGPRTQSQERRASSGERRDSGSAPASSGHRPSSALRSPSASRAGGDDDEDYREAMADARAAEERAMRDARERERRERLQELSFGFDSAQQGYQRQQQQQQQPQKQQQQQQRQQDEQQQHSSKTSASPTGSLSNVTGGRRRPLPPSPADSNHSASTSADAKGDDLPPMPSAAVSPSVVSPRDVRASKGGHTSSSAHAFRGGATFDEDDFWLSEFDEEEEVAGGAVYRNNLFPPVPPPQLLGHYGGGGSGSSGGGSGGGSGSGMTPVYVRTLGRLVRKLSAIESVGSAERDRSDGGGSAAAAGHGASSRHASRGGGAGGGSSATTNRGSESGASSLHSLVLASIPAAARNAAGTSSSAATAASRGTRRSGSGRHSRGPSADLADVDEEEATSPLPSPRFCADDADGAEGHHNTRASHDGDEGRRGERRASTRSLLPGAWAMDDDEEVRDELRLAPTFDPWSS